MALTTSGQLDWVGLTNNTITASTAIFQRLSQANVDPYTLAMAQAVSSHFKMSSLGQRRVHEALQGLKWCSSLGNALWFGVGVKHITRMLADTKEGTMCLALCASLSEVFSTEISARVLAELATVLGLPEGSGPSLQQWERLVTSCAGTLAATNFGCIAGHFIGLRGKYGTSMSPETPRVNHLYRGMSNITDLAQAMGAIVEISKGSLASITLIGGAACGWVAAFAYWFLGLDVEITRSDREQDILYSSSLNGQANVTVVYDVQGSNNALATRRRDATYIVRNFEEYYFLRLGDKRILKFSGRVPWESALAAAFGPQARILLQRQEFGVMLGAAARIFRAIFETDQGLSAFDIQNAWPGYCGGSFGFGYLQSALRWLPELQVVVDAAEGSSEGSLPQAYTAFNKAGVALDVVCACSLCQRVSGNTSNDDRSAFCLRLLADMIVSLVWSLSLMHMETPLQPSLKGLQHMYRLNPNGHRFGQDKGRTIDRLFNDRKKLTARLSVATVSATATMIFGGNLAPGPGIVQRFEHCQPSAFTSGGICFFFDMLKHISDRPDSATVLHVLPGCIQLKSGHTVTQVEDMIDLERLDRSRPTYPAGNRQPYDASKAAEDTGSNLMVDLLVKEAAAEAFVCFRLSSIEGRCCDIGVTSLLRAVLSSAGAVPCNAVRHQDHLTMPADGVATRDGEGLVSNAADHENGDFIVVRRLSRNTLARCVALVGARLYRHDKMSRTILRTHECLPCCVRAALNIREAMQQIWPGTGKAVVYIVA
ncbi:MAG: hypothetical protein M1830_002418 [Pleopsidium flavum]|nr:MAG: hypothetical protein M1830_002418 [Pleopsidium flavum]